MNNIVSVIVPMYNAEHTIKKCIESIISQSYKNTELIVIDDGSTDNSATLVKEYGPIINYIYQKNSGVSLARNKGIDFATGDYLLFVDSDDCIDKDFVERTVIFAQVNNLDVVVAGHTEENSTIYGGNTKESDEFVALSNKDVVDKFNEIHVGQAVGKLYKTDVIKNNRIVFPSNMKLAEDFYFVCDVICHTNKIGFVKNTYYRVFNININSLSKRYVDNISLGINKQLKIWDRLNLNYPGIDIAYAKDDMDYKLHKVKMYADNLFKKDSPITFKESITLINKFIKDNPNLFTENVPIKYYPNMFRKTEALIINSKHGWLISFFYYGKERIKQIKYKKIMNNRK